MPIFVSLLVCMSAQPGYCRQVIPTSEPCSSLVACQIEGMEQGAAWADQHPGWRVAAVRCTMGRPPPPEGSI